MKYRSAYIAIFLVTIIVATVLTMVVLNTIRTTGQKRKIDLETRLIELSVQAESCRDLAMLDRKANELYTEKFLNLLGASCTILSEANANEQTLTITVTRDGYARSFEQKIAVAQEGTAINITPISWKEI